nr:hypothetical protein [Prosthecochloris sp. ZM]
MSTDDGCQKLYANAPYIGQEETIESCGMRNTVHEKGNRYHKLTDAQKASNKEKSRTRTKVEHVLGCMTNSMNAM